MIPPKLPISLIVQKKMHISNANGDSYPVTGISTSPLIAKISLESVLLVPSLSHDLLSVSKLLNTHTCSAHFFPMIASLRTFALRKGLGMVLRRGICGSCPRPLTQVL